ncbi:MAG: hypothetical protein PHY83_06130, partial [Bacilli bacterium]|nr:hypothetical protein [Bacilli bacterium]
INDLGASQVYRATGALTTHLPVNTVVYLTYTTVSGVGRWVWANYVDGTESYTVRWNGAGVVAGESITKYKLLMMAPDGRYHPIAVGDSTAANAKTINSQPFVINSPILAYYTTATVAQNAATSTSSIYSAVSMSSNFRYNQNVQSGWIAHKPIYLKGTINNDGLFVLAGAGTTGGDYLTQDLPTTEDGYVYIMLGMMYSTTTSFRLNIEHPIIEFKDGKLRQYNSPELDPFYFSNPYNYLNSTSISGSETDPKWTGNYSTFLTHINWAQVTNGTMATAASVTAANTSMKNYVDYTNGTMKNYVDTNFYLKSNPYNYLNSTSISGAETDPKWTGNYSSRTGTGNVVYSANSVLTGTSFVETIRSTPSNGGAAFRIGGSNNDVSLFRVDASTGTSDSANYGFSLKYMGSRSGNENSLSLFTDQQTGSQMEAITVQQNGNVGIGTTSPSEKLDVQGGVNIYLG